MQKAQLPYTADAGTLLGLCRDGNLIPWDDDLDLMLPASAIPGLRRTFRRHSAQGLYRKNARRSGSRF